MSVGISCISYVRTAGAGPDDVFSCLLQELKVSFRFRHVPLLRVGEAVEACDCSKSFFLLGLEVTGETDVE